MTSMSICWTQKALTAPSNVEFITALQSPSGQNRHFTIISHLKIVFNFTTRSLPYILDAPAVEKCHKTMQISTH